MNVPLQISFRNLKPQAAVEELVRDQLDKLERHGAHVTACRVTVEVPHQRHEKGNLFQVSVDVTVPGAELVAGHRNSEPDVFAAVREAFAHVLRELHDFSQRRRDLIRTGPEQAGAPEPDLS